MDGELKKNRLPFLFYFSSKGTQEIVMVNFGRTRNSGEIMVALRDFTFHSVLFYNVRVSLLCGLFLCGWGYLMDNNGNNGLFIFLYIYFNIF